jgi:hypothetical protein
VCSYTKSKSVNDADGSCMTHQKAPPSMFEAEEWKSPDVSQSDRVTEARHEKVARVAPPITLSGGGGRRNRRWRRRRVRHSDGRGAIIGGINRFLRVSQFRLELPASLSLFEQCVRAPHNLPPPREGISPYWLRCLLQLVAPAGNTHQMRKESFSSLSLSLSLSPFLASSLGHLLFGPSRHVTS